MVTVFTQPGCMPCRATERMLAKSGIPYEMIDISVNAEAGEELRAGGFTSTPVVRYGDDVWSGYRPDKIRALALAAV